MEKQFITYQQALELKRLGFDEPCIVCFYGISRDDKEDGLYLPSGMGRVCNSDLNEKEHGITAPLWQQAFDYLLTKTKSAIIFPLSYEEKVENLNTLINLAHKL